MSRRTQALLFLVGATLFYILLRELGLGRLLANARETGWMLLPIVAVYAGVYACNSAACALVMRDEPVRPRFRRIYAIMVAGFALNSVTPVMQLGGEPYKVGAFGAWLGPRRATGTVVTYYMLNALSNLLTWFTAIVIVLAAFRPPVPVALGLLVLAVALAGAVAFVFSRQRAGIFGLATRILARLPVAGRAAAALERHRGTLGALDEQIVAFYHRDRRRFFLALAIDFAGRTVGMLEYYLIGASIGLHISFLQAFVMGSFLALGLNVLFFVPFDVGSREGGMFLIFEILGLPSGLGVYAGIVTRLRWASWIAIGLLVLAIPGMGRPRGAPASASEAEVPSAG